MNVSIPLSDAVHRSEQGSSNATPLVVNFETAILRTDLLHERIAAFVKSEPWMLPNLVLAASKSRAALDGFLIARADANPPLAPRNSASSNSRPPGLCFDRSSVRCGRING